MKDKFEKMKEEFKKMIEDEKKFVKNKILHISIQLLDSINNRIKQLEDFKEVNNNNRIDEYLENDIYFLKNSLDKAIKIMSISSSLDKIKELEDRKENCVDIKENKYLENTISLLKNSVDNISSIDINDWLEQKQRK